ncbi:transglutaminase family protein [Flavobacterium sp. H122]|uniref:transglutaminase-like domain-containing protein n=1 Tax=Flavobacterium sp. H122 TaxID=2529860 RepID=UPI0010A9D5FD|nr:transglutaminase-like domain-containing protein [Flavobacterium sp. H122]
MRAVILFVFILIKSFGWGQNDLDYYKQKYPNANEVIVRQMNQMEIRLDKNNINIISQRFDESVVITNDVNKIDAKGRVSFSTFSQIENLEASTVLNNKKYDVKNFRIVPDKNSRNFHDDIKIKEFDYSQLTLGAKKILKYTTHYLDPKLLSGEIFIENYPIEYKEYKLIVDKDIELGYKVFNDPNQSILFNKEEKGGKIIYKWTAKNIPQYKYEEGMPSVLYFVPIVEVYIKSYTNSKGEKVALLSSIGDLHKLYQEYTKDIYETPSEELVKKARELKALHENELDQVKEIYYWVKDNVKYIAFEDGYGGFIPRKPNDVFVKRYGDCKDMAVIIYTMLRSVGINDVYLTWIGSRQKPFTYDDLPTQMVDDHMIATYQNNGVDYFLDGTSKETPFGYPTSFIQGKQALLHKSKDEYEVVMVPVVPFEKNRVAGDILLQIEGDKLIGKSKVAYSGFLRENFLTSLKDLSGFDKTSFLKNELQLGNNKFFLGKYDIKNQENRDKELEVEYEFNIENYIVSADNEIYINLFLNKFDELKTLNIKREMDYHIENKSNYSQTIMLSVPKGYKVSYLPKGDTFQNENFSFSIAYDEKKDAVELKIDVKINFLALKKEKVQLWNDFINRLKENTNETIAIIKIH